MSNSSSPFSFGSADLNTEIHLYLVTPLPLFKQQPAPGWDPFLLRFFGGQGCGIIRAERPKGWFSQGIHFWLKSKWAVTTKCYYKLYGLYSQRDPGSDWVLREIWGGFLLRWVHPSWVTISILSTVSIAYVRVLFLSYFNLLFIFQCFLISRAYVRMIGLRFFFFFQSTTFLRCSYMGDNGNASRVSVWQGK